MTTYFFLLPSLHNIEYYFCQFDFDDITGVTAQSKDFIKKILVLDPKKSMSFADMNQHPFLQGEHIKFKYNLLTMTPIYEVQMQLPKITVLNMTIAKEKNATQSTFKQQSAALSQPEEKIKWNFTKVIAYVDYSTIYGLGYLLSSHIYGVYFNDSSLITFDQKENFLTYIDNPSVEENQLQTAKYFIEDIDSTHKLNKKYLLLKRFKSYLDQQRKQSLIVSQQSTGRLIYVKQWLKTKHAIMFRLNNKLFQVEFFDGSSITLNTKLKHAVVRSKKGTESTMTMEAARSNENAQVAKRMNYIRQILHNLKNK